MWQLNQAKRAFSIDPAGLLEDAMLTPSANLRLPTVAPLALDKGCFTALAGSQNSPAMTQQYALWGRALLFAHHPPASNVRHHRRPPAAPPAEPVEAGL